MLSGHGEHGHQIHVGPKTDAAYIISRLKWASADICLFFRRGFPDGNSGKGPAFSVVGGVESSREDLFEVDQWRHFRGVSPAGGYSTFPFTASAERGTWEISSDRSLV